MVTQALAELGERAGTVPGAWERARAGTGSWSHPGTAGQPRCGTFNVLPTASIPFQIIQHQARICTGQKGCFLYANS